MSKNIKVVLNREGVTSFLNSHTAQDIIEPYAKKVMAEVHLSNTSTPHIRRSHSLEPRSAVDIVVNKMSAQDFKSMQLQLALVKGMKLSGDSNRTEDEKALREKRKAKREKEKRRAEYRAKAPERAAKKAERERKKAAYAAKKPERDAKKAEREAKRLAAAERRGQREDKAYARRKAKERAEAKKKDYDADV